MEELKFSLLCNLDWTGLEIVDRTKKSGVIKPVPYLLSDVKSERDRKNIPDFPTTTLIYNNLIMFIRKDAGVLKWHFPSNDEMFFFGEVHHGNDKGIKMADVNIKMDKVSRGASR